MTLSDFVHLSRVWLQLTTEMGNLSPLYQGNNDKVKHRSGASNACNNELRMPCVKLNPSKLPKHSIFSRGDHRGDVDRYLMSRANLYHFRKSRKHISLLRFLRIPICKRRLGAQHHKECHKLHGLKKWEGVCLSQFNILAQKKGHDTSPYCKPNVREKRDTLHTNGSTRVDKTGQAYSKVQYITINFSSLGAKTGHV